MGLIISADLSLNSSGFCIAPMEKGAPVHYEHVSSDLEGIERLNYNYYRYITILSSRQDIECIAYEEQNPQMRFSYSAGSLLALAENVGVWKLAIYHSLPHFTTRPLILGIPAQDIKKYATGNGQATKEDMIASVNGTHIKSIKRDIPEHAVNDVSDSYHLTMMVRDLLHKDKDAYAKYVVKDYGELLKI